MEDGAQGVVWNVKEGGQEEAVHGRVLIMRGQSPKWRADVACRLAAITNGGGGGGASQIPS